MEETIPEIEITDEIMLAALSVFGYEPEGPSASWDREMVTSQPVALVCAAIVAERLRCLAIVERSELGLLNYQAPNIRSVYDSGVRDARTAIASLIRSGV